MSPEEFKEKWQKLSDGLVDNFVLISMENNILNKKLSTQQEIIEKLEKELSSNKSHRHWCEKTTSSWAGAICDCTVKNIEQTLKEVSELKKKLEEE